MLSYVDCKDMCDLTEEEIEAIAEHEHLPQIVAAELGNYLVHSDEGVPMIKKIILDDIEHAIRHNQPKRAAQLKMVLRHFVETHPEHRTID